jgi:hypothetical protein
MPARLGDSRGIAGWAWCGSGQAPLWAVLLLGFGSRLRGCWCRLFVRLMVGARMAKPGLGRAEGGAGSLQPAWKNPHVAYESGDPFFGVRLSQQ